MHFWGLTIDTVSCINLILAIGLCVDYAAHIAHTFMVKTGTKNERAAATIASIGPAVFHGGFSTFLAFIFLADSDSHVFTTFFKAIFNFNFFLFILLFKIIYCRFSFWLWHMAFFMGLSSSQYSLALLARRLSA